MYLNNVNMVQNGGGGVGLHKFSISAKINYQQKKQTNLIQSYVKLLNQFKTPKITEIFKMQLAVGI